MVKTKQISFYRNIKINKDNIVTYYRFKKNINPLMFDLIDLYLEKNILSSIIFRLFLSVEIYSITNP